MTADVTVEALYEELVRSDIVKKVCTSTEAGILTSL